MHYGIGMVSLQPAELLFLGIIQGVAEWLPVSSEGMIMIVLLNVFKTDVASAFSYAVFLHLGTMLAVLAKFRRDVIKIIFERPKTFNIILVATVFTSITALPLMIFIKNFEGRFANVLIGLLLIVTGILLRLPKSGYRKASEMTALESALLGIAQGFAILPGISRSGTTVSYLLLRRVNEEDALKLSFLVSIPAIAGAIMISSLPSGISMSGAAIVVTSAFVTGYIMIDFLLKIARNIGFSLFCILFGSVAVIFSLLTM